MYPLNDNDLDRLSREAADQYDVEPRTSGWEALQHRLDKELPLNEDKERRRFLFWLFLIVLLAGGGVLWTMTNSDRPAIVQVTGANKMPVTKEEEAVNENKTTASETGQARGQSGDGPTPMQPGQPLAGKPDRPASHQPAASQSDRSATNQPVTSRPDRPTVGQPAKRPTDHNLSAGSSTANDQKTTGRQDRINIDDIARIGKTNKSNRKTNNQNRTDLASGPTNARGNRKVTAPDDAAIDPGNKTTTVPAGSGAFAPLQDRLPVTAAVSAYRDPVPSAVQEPNKLAGKRGIIQATVHAPTVENKPAPEPIQRMQQPMGLEVGLLAGPDMSNVRFTDVDKVGYNVGLQVAYRFNNRWSVNSGLIYTRKNYTAQGKDFTKPPGNYWDNADVKVVAGDCAMFDIPVNVRYDLSFNKKTRWFVSAGASSYIMTNQNYTVNYEYNGMPRVYPHEDYATSTYLFSIVNLSAGFETKLNKHLSLQAEPYFKLPTKGLGYGKLDLNSYGLYFSLRYHLHK